MTAIAPTPRTGISAAGASVIEATFIRDLPPTRTGALQKLYRPSDPYRVRAYGDDEGELETSFVVTSAAVAYGGPETYVFAADKRGHVLDWSELPGSFRGSLDHERAIAGFVESAS